MKKIILILMSCCIVSISFLCACFESPIIGRDWQSRASWATVGIGDIFQNDNGTFCLEEVAYAKSIESGNVVYEDNDGGYLIVKMQFNFANYQLKECGIIIEDYSKPEIMHRNVFWVNYFESKLAEHDCSIKKDGDLILELLGTNMHINEAEGEVRGKAYACFNLNTEVRDYLLDVKEGKYLIEHDESILQFDVNIYLNNIRYEKIKTTEIGCLFTEINFYDNYQM